MDGLNSYERLVTAALLASLGLCTALAGVKFFRNRAKTLSILQRAQGALFALLFGSMATIAVIDGTAKVTNAPPNQLQQIGGFGRPLRTGGVSLAVTEDDKTNGWRAVGGEGSVAPVEMPSGAVTNDLLRRRGGGDWAFRVAPEGWSFPCRGGFVEGVTVLAHGEVRIDARTPYFPVPIAEGVTVLAHGEVRIDARTPYFPVPIAEGVSLLPMSRWGALPNGGASVFSHAVTDYGSLLLDWRNALAGRNVNNPTNMQLELFGDGSFEWRTEDSSQLYAPVFPFDWDGDGLENSVDPEPLVAGPDAHGTNAEWYNVVCSNVYAAAEGGPGAVPAMADTEVGPPGIVLSPRTSDVNTNAYYFVEVVASRGPAPIYFTGDRDSRLGNPVVVAHGGETDHVPLLMGIEYAVTSTVPFSVSAPSNAVATMAGFNDGRAFNVKWPLLFDLTVDDGGDEIDVGPFDPGGTFSWGTGGAPHLLGGPPATCHHQTFSNRVAFVGCGDCNCGGATVNGQYCIENATFGLPAVFCQCMGYGGASPQAPMDPDVPHFEVSFSRPVVIFEDAYEASPGIMVGRRSTDTALSLYAYGGTNGATVTISTAKLKNLATSSGSPVILPERIILSPCRSFCAAFTCEGVMRSEGANDVQVGGRLVEKNTGGVIDDNAMLTAICVEFKMLNRAPQNPCIHRHKCGIGEKMYFWQLPVSPEVNLILNDAVVVGSGGARSIEWGVADVEHSLRVSLCGAEYDPLVSVVKPTGIEGYNVHAVTNGTSSGVAGGIALFQGYRVLPLDVLFDGISVEEVPCSEEIAPEGYFAYTPTNQFLRSHTRRAGAGYWMRVKKENYVGGEDLVDKARCFVSLPRRKPDGTETTDVSYGWLGGSLTWKVPLGWGGKNMAEFAEPYGVFAEETRQRFLITPQGDVTVEKLGNSAERKIDGRVFLGVVGHGVVEQFNVSGE